MKIEIIKQCRSPLGEHAPGDAVDIEQSIGDYFVANGYAKLPRESAESPRPKAESAMIEPAKKSRKTKG